MESKVTYVPYINTAIAGLVFIILISCFLLLRRKANVRSMPPMAPGGWPIIGHLPLLLSGGARLPHITLGALADRCGPIFTIRLGIHRAVVVSTWEVAKECFTTHDLALSSRPKFTASKYLTYNYAMFAFAPYGSYWREIRKIATLELLSHRRLELLSHVRVSEVAIFVNDLYNVWRAKKDESGHVSVEMKERFSNMSLNIVLRMVAGKRFDTNVSEDPSYEIEKRRCVGAMRGFFEYIGSSVVSDAFPFLEWLDIGGHVKKMRKLAEELDSYLSEWLEEHRHKEVFGDDDDEQDVIDAMISTVHGANLAGYDNDTIIKSTCLALIAGATDTSTVTLTWAVSLLLNNPQSLSKAQQELDTVVGKERSVHESDITKLIYLQSIVKETIRIHAPTPLLAPRVFTEDCIVSGYHIPKGTRMIPNSWKIQNDPRVWSDPPAFRPERFVSGPNMDVDLIKGQHYHFTPFGSGRRGCPGASFGLQVVHLALARFLQAFEVSNPSNEPVDMTESFGLTNMKATPLDVLLKPRVRFAL